jgi:hypothetical protein
MIGLCVIGCLGAAGILGYTEYVAQRTIFESTWRIEYGTMPTNDDALLDLLKSQPGLEGVSVARDGKALIVRYEFRGGQTLPQIMEKTETLGYGDRRSFHNEIRVKQRD